MYCICCNKKINIFGSLSEDEVITTSAKDINSLMVNGGIFGSMSAGYGSNLDGDILKIAICDACARVKLNEGTILYDKNYMGEDDDILKEKSLKAYNRRNNLNSLV